MEGYRVISSKKVLLCDITNVDEHKVDTSLQAEFKEISSSPISFDVVELSCNPVPHKVIELSSPVENDNEENFCDDYNSSQTLDYLTKNDSNAQNYVNDESNSFQKNSQSNNNFGFSTAQNYQLDKLSTSNALDIDQNVPVKNEALADCSEYLPIDSNIVINLSVECSKKPTSLESGNASENVNAPAIGYRSGRVVANQNSIEEHIFYLCPQCGLDCGPIEKWKLHTEAEHGFGLLETANFECSVNKKGNLCHKCRDCSKTVHIGKGFYVLLLHRISHHLPFKKYIACRICLRKYKYKQALTRHLKHAHEDLFVNTNSESQDRTLEYIRFFCPICKKEQSNKIAWETHMEKQHNYFRQAHSNFKHLRNNIYICGICKAEVRELRSCSLVEHMHKHDEINSFLCNNCNYSSTQMWSILRHVRLKHLRTPKELELECVLCKATFKSKRQRIKHYKNVHKITNQLCKVCKKTFVSSSFLLSHMVTANHHVHNSKT